MGCGRQWDRCFADGKAITVSSGLLNSLRTWPINPFSVKQDESQTVGELSYRLSLLRDEIARYYILASTQLKGKMPEPHSSCCLSSLGPQSSNS